MSQNIKKINNINLKDIQYLTNIIGSQNVISGLESNILLDKYNNDWLKKYKGYSELILKPKNSLEVSNIVKYCYSNNIKIITQGGLTSLVGGSTPISNEVCISMERMNKIIEFNHANNEIKAESGTILQTLETYLENYKRVFPLDLGAKGSCMLGGNLSTNAGGIHFIKYGSLRDNCTELTIISGKGEILKFNNKSNFNSILKNLLIGSEGTLGIITEASIKTYSSYPFKNIALIAVNNFPKIIEIYQKAIISQYLKNKITAFEYFDYRSRLLTEKYLNLDHPFDHHNNENNEYYYVLIEVSNNEDNNLDLLMAFLDDLYTDNPNENEFDALITQDNSQLKNIWQLRERISEASVKKGLCLKYDVSLKLEKMNTLVENIRNKVSNDAYVIGYGHIGDCNVHINVCLDSYEKNDKYYKVLELVEPYIFNYLQSINGSISAEHGIGQCKTQYLDRNQSAENISLMKVIKNSFDPKNILNPGKLININI